MLRTKLELEKIEQELQNLRGRLAELEAERQHLLPQQTSTTNPTELCAEVLDQMAQRLQQTEVNLIRLTAVVENMNEGVVIADPNGNVLTMNRAARRIHDLNEPPEIQRHISDFPTQFKLYDLDDELLEHPLPTEQWPLSRAIKGESFTNRELRIRRIDTNAEYIASYTGTPVYSENAEVAYAVLTMRDITEEKLRDLRNQFLTEVTATLATVFDYSKALEVLGDLMIKKVANWCAIDMVEPDGKIRRAIVTASNPSNQAFCAQFMSYVPDNNVKALVPLVLQTGQSLLEPSIKDEVLQAVAKDARHLELMRHFVGCSSLTVPLIVSGRILGSICLMREDRTRPYTEEDVAFMLEIAQRAAVVIDNAHLYEQMQLSLKNEQKLTLQKTTLLAEREALLHEVQNYAIKLEDRVRERTHKLEQANRYKSQFLSQMSHELRTPLNSILGFTNILLKGLPGPLNDEQQYQLSLVRGSAEQLLSLINGLLDLARIESGKTKLKLSDFDLVDVTANVIETMQPLAKGKNLDLQLELEPSIINNKHLMFSDELKFKQILLNLLSNAIKFTDVGYVKVHASKMSWPEGCQECSIHNQRLMCKETTDWLKIEIIDTGIGIEPERVEMLFEEFGQLAQSGTRSEIGTGLGLALTRQLVQLLGGYIEVFQRRPSESDKAQLQPKGTVFAFYLPLRCQLLAKNNLDKAKLA